MANLPNQSREPIPSLIEIGNFVLMARVFPEKCAWYWMGKQQPGPVADYQRRLTLPNIFDLRRKLNAPSTRLAFVHVPIRPKRTLDQGILRMLYGDFGALAFREALSAKHCPLVGLDFNDATELSDIALKILERSTCFFKRELPTDFRRLLPKNASSAQVAFVERNAHKLMPISLGLCSSRISNLPRDCGEKKYDLFFSGDTSSTVRKGEFCLLEKLRELGVRVCQPESRLTQQEFLKACAQSYLVWSPEGAGWDCFRHYEAAASGSVPVMNVPPITCYRRLVHNQHALYYLSDCREKTASGAEFGNISDGFVSTVTKALQNRQRLEQMGRDAREFVLQHHTHEAIVNHIIRVAESRRTT